MVDAFNFAELCTSRKEILPTLVQLEMRTTARLLLKTLCFVLLSLCVTSLRPGGYVVLSLFKTPIIIQNCACGIFLPRFQVSLLEDALLSINFYK